MFLTPRSVAFNLGIVAAWGLVAMLSNIPPPPPPMLPPPLQTLVIEELLDDDDGDEDPAFFSNRTRPLPQSKSSNAKLPSSPSSPSSWY